MTKKLTALAAMLLASGAHADFDGSEALLCTLMTANICDYDGCERASRADLGGLHHLVVDFKRDRVKSPETDLQAPISGVKPRRWSLASSRAPAASNSSIMSVWPAPAAIIKGVIP